MEVKEKVIQILTAVTGNEYKKIFYDGMPPDEQLQLLTSESMLALIFITSIEDEFGIEFEDDEVDINFFNSVDGVTEKIQRYL
jgi:acyl carrier protein